MSRHSYVRTALAGAVALASMSFASGALAQDPERVSLEVGISVPNTINAPMVWALQQGIFDRLGLDFTFRVTRTLTTTEAATGRLVLGTAGPTTVFPAIEEDRSMKVVVNMASGNGSAFITVMADSPYQKLEDLAGQPVGVVGATGPGYGGAKAYSDYIVSKGGAPLEIVARRDAPSNGAALTTGEIAAAIGTPVYGDQIKAGRMRLLVDAGTDDMRQLLGASMPNVTYFGLDESVQANREAVVRFIAGMRVANRALAKVTPERIAEVMGKDENFSPSVISQETLAEQLSLGRPFFPKEEGFISADDWNGALKIWEGWELKVPSGVVDLTQAKYSYENVVDMSYWNEATALIEKTEFTAEMLGE